LYCIVFIDNGELMLCSLLVMKTEAASSLSCVNYFMSCLHM